MAHGGEGGHGESTGAILAAFSANMGIAATKFVGFLITGSSSLLAEAIHSVADSSNQGLLFLGGRQAQQSPDELHQFGYGRVRYFWAFVVAVVLFTLGGLFAVYRATTRSPTRTSSTRRRWRSGSSASPSSWRPLRCGRPCATPPRTAAAGAGRRSSAN